MEIPVTSQHLGEKKNISFENDIFVIEKKMHTIQAEESGE